MHNPERALSALHALDPGVPREQWVRIAMAAKSAGLTFEDFDAWSSQASNYSGEADTRSVWKSIDEQGGVKAGSLYALAKAAGWREDRAAGNVRPLRAAAPVRAPRPVPARPAPRSSLVPLDPAAIWMKCQPASIDHGYIDRKLGLADGLRVYHGPLTIAGEAIDGYLAVPAVDLDGEVKTLQFIPPAPGKKLNLPGHAIAGCFPVGGPISADRTIYVTEGIGQAWSAHQATRDPAVCAFGFGRMATVAADIRARFPDARLVFVADVGKEIQCEALASQFGGAWAAVPGDLGDNGDLNDLHKRDGLEAVRAVLEAAHEPVQRYELLTPDQFSTRQTTPIRIKGIAAASGIGAIGGSSTAGKTFLGLDLGAAISEGRTWFGHRVHQCPVLFIVQEGQAGFGKRLQAYQKRRGAFSGFRVLAQPFDLRRAQDELDLVAAIKAADFANGVVIIDTLAQVTPGMDENSSADMGEAIAAVKRIQSAVGGLIILVHHIGKDAAKGLRGHSSLFAALDFVIEVVRNDSRREWRLAKAKDGEDGIVHHFHLEPVELGLDEDGDPIKSLVVVEDETVADTVRRAVLPSGGNQLVAWHALGELLRDSRQFGMGGAPASRPCVSIEEAITHIRGRLVELEPKRRKERATQSITGLVNRGLIASKDGWLWAS